MSGVGGGVPCASSSDTNTTTRMAVMMGAAALNAPIIPKAGREGPLCIADLR